MSVGQDVFEELLCRLEPGQASSNARYKSFRKRLIKIFAWKACEDAEGLADETISRLVGSLTSGKEIRSPAAYVRAIAENVFKEYLRHKKRGELPESGRSDADSDPARDLRDCRRQCLDDLPADKRTLLEDYYLQTCPRAELARRRGLSLNALRLQVFKIKREMDACYKDCMKRMSGSRN